MIPKEITDKLSSLAKENKRMEKIIYNALKEKKYYENKCLKYEEIITNKENLALVYVIRKLRTLCNLDYKNKLTINE